MKSIRYITTIVFTGMAYAATPITACTTIATPGNYFLTADLAGANCITINSNNTSLALNGHIITGPGTGAGITVTPISGRIDHVGITGPGLITGYSNGIAIVNSDYVQVSLVTASGNVTNGINSAGTNSFLTVASNILTENGVWGALLTATNSSVSNNEMAGNGFGPGTSHPAGGMRLTGSANSISNNLVLGNGKLPDNTNTLNAGIVVNTTGSQISGNVADGNNGFGIEVQNTGSGNQLFKNKALGNIGTDLQDDNAACDSNSWVDNTFFTRNPTSCVK
jgi:hypothetical protein